jgi:hypothetical protein
VPPLPLTTGQGVVLLELHGLPAIDVFLCQKRVLCWDSPLTSKRMTDKPQAPAQSSWEDEGGALAPERKQKTSRGAEIPVPKRRVVMDALRKLVHPPRRS